jgi:signal transduction histidine kinase
MVVLERRIDETLEPMASYRVAVAIDRKLLEAANRAFVLDLLPTLAGIAAGLLGAFALQGGIALWPIARARHVLRELRDGRREKLSGALPSELEGLAAEFDALLEAQRHGARRARERAADLAHGLRTPLALLAARVRDLRDRGEAEAAAAIEAIAASIDGRMARELARAHIQGPAGHGGAGRGAVPLQPIVERVSRAFARMPGGAHLAWRVEIPPDLAGAAEEGDLVELLGVLLDNAAKWARSEVHIGAHAGDGLVSLTVEDDGPGIPPQDRRAALGRGVRLDPDRSGTGLGLSIAGDIAAAYGGEVRLGDSRLGGLCVTVSWPRHAAS